MFDPGDPQAFAGLSLNGFRDFNKPMKLAGGGRDVALQNFDYSIWVKKLSEFIKILRIAQTA